MAIIASKGTLDMAYIPLVLASTAVSMDVEVRIFFILYGVDIVNKKKNHSLMVTPSQTRQCHHQFVARTSWVCCQE